MIQRRPVPSGSSLFEVDETAWLEQTARLVRQRCFEDLDADHLCELLIDMSRRDRREVLNRLTVLLAHLLKWEHQPERRSNSWRATIDHQRDELGDLLESATLRRHAEDVLGLAFERARHRTVLETGLPEESFPEVCTFCLERALSGDTL